MTSRFAFPNAALARRVGVALLALFLGAVPARASCDLFPTVERSYEGVLGATNRPYAAPGETLEIRHRDCDDGGKNPAAQADQNLVTVAFLDPGGQSGSLVVVADECDDSLTALVDACSMTIGVDAAACVPSDELEVAGSQLRFTFPETASLFGGEDLVGPARIAVTRRGEPVPCSLARRGCEDMSGTDICVDSFFEDSGACDTATPAGLFTHFTALPRPNEFSAACFRDDALCAATEPALRLAADEGGNLFMPIHWNGVLAEQDEFPIPRLVRATIDSPIPFHIPDEAFAASFTEDGGRLPPIFTPLFEETPLGDADKVVLFGSADAPYTILRFAKRFGVCEGGSDEGALCEDDTGCSGAGALCEMACVDDPGRFCQRDADCATGACGKLFDASGLYESGTLLNLVRDSGSNPAPGVCQLPPHASCEDDGDCPAVGDACVFWALEAGDAVPLDGILETDDLWAFTFDEEIDGIDRNGDGDAIDTVVTVRSRQTAVSRQFLPPGPPAVCAAGAIEGRNTMRLASGAFEFVAVRAEGKRVAFLEPEADFGAGCDIDGNGSSDGIALSMTSLGDEGAVLSTDAAVVPDLMIDGGALALGDGVAFARFSEVAAGEDYTGDGLQKDVVLGFLEEVGGFGVSCAAEEVATHGRTAAFLRPEMGLAGSVECPAGSLNDDGDSDDRVVSLLKVDAVGTGVLRNLGLAASMVDLSDDWIAALAPEGGEPLATNVDGDNDDQVVFLRARDGAAPSWISLGLAADRIHLEDELLIVRVPEADEAAADLNGDEDADDLVLHVFVAEDFDTGSPGPAPGPVERHRRAGSPGAGLVLGAAEDFVIGSEEATCPGTDRLVRPLAFSQPFDADEDGAEDEYEMHVFNAALQGGAFESSEAIASGMTVHPCDQWACDPRRPFHVEGSELRFLTDEAEQGADLDGDGLADDIVLQIFDLCSGLTRTVGAIDADVLTRQNPLRPRPSIAAGQVLVQTSGRCLRPAPFCGMGEKCGCPDGSSLVLRSGKSYCLQAAPASCVVDSDCGAISTTGATCELERVAIAVNDADEDADGIIDSSDTCDANGIAGACVDGLLCRRARMIEKKSGIAPLQVADYLGSRTVTPKAIDVACTAVGLGGSEVNDTERFVSRWKIAAAPFEKLVGVRAKDRFGLHELLVKRPTSLMLPATEDEGAVLARGRGYQCYDVREIERKPGGHRLTLTGDEEPEARSASYKLGRMKRLCLEAKVGIRDATEDSVQALLCYRGKPVEKSSPRPWDVDVSDFTDAIGAHEARVGKEREVCLRSVVSRVSLGLATESASATAVLSAADR